MTTRRTKPTKSDTMTAAISADPSRDVVLQALLADDLMACREFAFGVVRPGILFKPNWHLEAVTYKLSQVAKGLVRRLIITLPPRTLKSLCASVSLPAWFLGHYPSERVVVVSYSDILAATTRTTSAVWLMIPSIERPSPPCASIATPTARSRPPSGASASRPRSTGRSPGSGETSQLPVWRSSYL